jgi:hypothetical protein
MANNERRYNGPRTTRRALVAFFAFAALIASRPAAAQTVQARISSDEAFVGEAVTVDVTVSNMGEAVRPTPPETQDFEIIASTNPPRREQQVSIMNGRRTDNLSFTYQYDVRPLQVGRFVLPPFQVTYRGQVYFTQQFPIHVVKDTASSLVFCEIKAPVETVYVGQAVNLTLEVWVQKFKQAGVGGLDVQSMWSPQLRNAAATSLGVFAGAEIERVRYAEQKRKDEAGVLQDYFVYRIENTVFPKTPGPFDFGDVVFAYNYPVRLTRDFFNMRLERTRRLRVAAAKPSLTVKALPVEGRPPDFNGAIGVYSIRTSARPTEVPVGDPITLNIEIGGSGPLERLSPPRLDQVEALRRDFEISGESLAGTVEGDHKVFSQTIRALREDVNEIPAVPMSYFDIKTGQYETSWSDPIALTVKPAERLVLTNQGGSGDRGGVLAPLSETTEGLFANEDRAELVLADQSGAIGAGSWLLLAAAPLVYLGMWFIQRRAARFRDDVALRRRSRAYATARGLLRDADGTSLPGAVRGALLGYIADRCNVPAAGLTRAEAVRLINTRGIPVETVQAVDLLLESLESAEYGGAAGAVQDGTNTARQLVDALERHRLK